MKEKVIPGDKALCFSTGLKSKEQSINCYVFLLIIYLACLVKMA